MSVHPVKCSSESSFLARACSTMSEENSSAAFSSRSRFFVNTVACHCIHGQADEPAEQRLYSNDSRVET